MKPAAFLITLLVTAFAYTALVAMAAALERPFDLIAVFGLLWILLVVAQEGVVSFRQDDPAARSGARWTATGLALVLSWVFRDIDDPTWTQIFMVSWLCWPVYMMASQGLSQRWKQRKWH